MEIVETTTETTTLGTDKRELIVWLEPTGACNIRCRHCYHADTKYDSAKMKEETLRAFLDSVAPNFNKVRIIWHGGEPLLMGVEFFERAYDIFAEYAEKYGVEFDFGVQTNGTLLNERFVELFKRTNTTVSVSYDGQYNDVLRQETKKTKEAVNLLKASSAKVCCLSTASRQSIDHLVEVYEEFKKLGVGIKFNPVFESGAAACHKEYVLTKEEWTDGFLRLFDYWFFDENCNICFASCESVLERFIGPCKIGCPSACLFRYIAIDAYGNLYPCGRMISPEYLLCNVAEIADVRQAYLAKNYLKLKDDSIKRIASCKGCKWFSKCRGGCNATARISGDVGEKNEFDCYFSHKVYEHIEKLLKGADLEKVNPYAREILKK